MLLNETYPSPSPKPSQRRSELERENLLALVKEAWEVALSLAEGAVRADLPIWQVLNPETFNPSAPLVGTLETITVDPCATQRLETVTAIFKACEQCIKYLSMENNNACCAEA